MSPVYHYPTCAMPETVPCTWSHSTTPLLFLLLLPAILVVNGSCSSKIASDPYTSLPRPSLTSTIPLDVLHPLENKPVENRPWFDTFSWQSFIALNWPVNATWPQDSTTRGMPQLPNQPSTFLTASSATIEEHKLSNLPLDINSL